jgi:thiol-disulfide isomerase/thioredoxin
MTKHTTGNLSTGRLAGIAAVLGLLAGAGAVYVMGGGDGNDEIAVVSAGQAAVGDAGSCPDTASRVETLTPLATGDVAAMAPTTKPQSVAGLRFDGPDGTAMTLGDLSGKTLLVNLWATWCAPCREEMPALDALQTEAGGQDFEVVAINIDTGDVTKATDFLTEIGVDNLALYRDASMGVFNDLKRTGLAFGLPVTLLVDDEGCLLGAMNGPAHWSGADALRLVEGARGI